MNKRFEIFLFIILFYLICTSIVSGSDYKVNTNAQLFILEKLKTHHIVFLGTTHKKPAILKFMLELIPALHDAGVTHIGLEITSSQQAKTDNFIQTGKKLNNIKIHPLIDCLEYRNLLAKLATLDPNMRPKTIALDLPTLKKLGKISRDKWMAWSIVKVFHKNPKAKMLVLAGNVHVLKVLNWQDNIRNQHRSMYRYLKDIMPEIRIFSISQLIDENPEECDFTEVFGSIDGSVVINCDRRFDGWKFGLSSIIAIKPTAICDLVDGIIIY
ncbi:MAG: hypothetical protein BA873_06115 [Desulfobulbaceae bacterium C00003063]|nr:MAG: hypothetical protein BA873_06115 [Desulfobulbaceae bacterium C00003063]